MDGCIIQSGLNKQREHYILVYRLEFNACDFPDSTLLYFAGVAIWVFFVLANPSLGLQTGPGLPGLIGQRILITLHTACNFTLDGLLIDTYNSPQPDGNTPEYQYNVCAYSTHGLSNDNHTMVISTNVDDPTMYLNFDYAIYTYVYSVIAPSGCCSNIKLGLMNPITRLRRLQDLHPPAISLAPQDLQQPICHHPTT